MARSIPDWPRMMRRDYAAAYCDMPGAEFDREVAAGILPAPIRLGSKEHWSRAALDAALDRLTGDGVPDWRKSQPLYSGEAA